MKLHSLALLIFAAFASGAETRRPNIIFILSDDLAQGDIGCYGQKLIQTPNLDRMAKEGTRFTQGYCGTTVCAPSRTSLMLGQHTGHSPVRANREIKPEGQLPLPAGTVTVAKILKDNGYATACMGKWGMGMFDTTGSPLKNGFDHFFGYNCQRHAHSYFPTYLYRDDQRFELPGNTGKGVGKTYAQELIQQDVEGWVRAQKDKPFFLYYASHENHVPRVHNPRYAGKTPLGPRGDAVVAFDDQAGRILAELDKHGLAENTLVIYSSDNGPVLDDGYKDKAVELNKQAGHTPAGPFRGGKYSILEGGTRVGFLARWPGHTPAGKVSDALMSQVDLPAVFTKVAGGDPADFLKLDSVDTSAALTGGAGRETLISSTQGNQLSIRDARWKFISGVGAPGKGKKAQGPVVALLGSESEQANDSRDQAGPRLFDLQNDPGERVNVAKDHPEIVARLKALLEAQRAKGVGQPLPK